MKRARAEGLLLPPGTPTERRPLAALVVKVRMARREAWREQLSLSQGQLGRLSRQPPAKVLAARATAKCLHRLICYVPCSKCSRYYSGRMGTPGCGLCRPFVELDHYRDRRMSMAEVYVPRQITSLPAMHSFESALEAVVPAKLPEGLRCLDLQPRMAGTAYRSAAGRTKAPTFFGHHFGDAIDRGREAVDRFMLRGPIVAHEIRAYAWPFVWLRWGPEWERQELAIFPDGRGRLHSFVGTAPGADDE